MNVLTADLDLQLWPNSPALDLLRKVHEYKGPGYDPYADPTMYDTDPLWDLLRDGLVRWSWEPGGFLDPEGHEAEIRVWHLTEEGLAELVLHGRAR